MPNQTTGLNRIIKAAGYSYAGFKAALQHEAAFRQEVLLCCLFIPAAMFIGETGVQRALLTAVCLLVLVVELINSAIEAIVDRVGSEHHVLSGRAKDMGSAAVTLSLCTAGITWLLILSERYA